MNWLIESVGVVDSFHEPAYVRGTIARVPDAFFGRI
jgi:hypothetical protein